MKPRETPEDSNERPGQSATEQRKRLLAKLKCLITVLEVAIGKIGDSMEAKGANKERLEKIKTNLQNTLAICRRAKETLETRIATEAARTPAERANRPSAKSEGKKSNAFRSYIELSSIDEFRKFKKLEAIKPEDLRGLDMDELAKRLADDGAA